MDFTEINSAEGAFRFCKERIPELEHYFLSKKEVKWAFHYAAGIIRGRFIEAEEYIKTDPMYSSWYAVDVINGRWPDAEEIILGSVTSEFYVKNTFSLSEKINLLKISQEDFLILKLKFNDEELLDEINERISDHFD